MWFGLQTLYGFVKAYLSTGFDECAPGDKDTGYRWTRTLSNDPDFRSGYHTIRDYDQGQIIQVEELLIHQDMVMMKIHKTQQEHLLNKLITITFQMVCSWIINIIYYTKKKITLKVI